MKFRSMVESNQGKTLDASTKRKLNKKISELTVNKYLNKIPLAELDKILKEHGCLLVDEDGTALQVVLTGESSGANFEIGVASTERIEGKFGLKTYDRIRNAMLRLTWHKMDSGRYEIVAYIT